MCVHRTFLCCIEFCLVNVYNNHTKGTVCYMIDLKNDWTEILKPDFESESYQKLREFLKYAYKNTTVYPDMYDIYNALRLTSYEDTKVVILGQDPYHGPGQAHGLAFSVQTVGKFPPSLQNIFKELNKEFGYEIPKTNGNLTSWAKQGVLLLNTLLTVEEYKPSSHMKRGWEELTDSIINHLNNRENPMVFLLWGTFARSKKALITNPKHIVLETTHPSPLSAYGGFLGSNCFKNANEELVKMGYEPINWQIKD